MEELNEQEHLGLTRTILLFLLLLIAILLGSYSYVNNYVHCGSIYVEVRETTIPGMYSCTQHLDATIINEYGERTNIIITYNNS